MATIYKQAPPPQRLVKLTLEAYEALKEQAQDERRKLSAVASYAIMEYVRAQREREERP